MDNPLARWTRVVCQSGKNLLGEKINPVDQKHSRDALDLSVNHAALGRKRGLMDAFSHGWMRMHS